VVSALNLSVAQSLAASTQSSVGPSQVQRRPSVCRLVGWSRAIVASSVQGPLLSVVLTLISHAPR